MEYTEMKNLNDIEDNKEGKLLIAALSILTTENRTDKTPDEVLKELIDRRKSIDETDKELSNR